MIKNISLYKSFYSIKNISKAHLMCDYVDTILTKNCGFKEITYQSLK